MKKAIDVLIAPGAPEIVDALATGMRQAGLAFRLHHAANEQNLADQLRCHAPDVILSSHGKSSFDSRAALAVAREIRPDVPFIFVTDPLLAEPETPSFDPQAENVLAAPLRQLAPTVRRALREARQQARLREVELMALTSRWR
ncbi:MAG: hypothetical protein L0Y58_00195 [Verrucomicrobia subdivision 3 bacterium]|nr:hypothetical protein [Limisphaerales bacterium]